MIKGLDEVGYDTDAIRQKAISVPIGKHING